jgi:hypothetical protein
LSNPSGEYPQRIKEALEFVSATAYSISNDSNEKARDRLHASMVFLQAEIYIHQSDPNVKKFIEHILPKLTT